MKMLEFLLGEEQLPIYRTVTPQESEVLRALLGADFRFPLVDGEPLDDLVFSVLAAMAMRSDVYFTPPLQADVLGTFELRDASLPMPATPPPLPRRPLRPRTH